MPCHVIPVLGRMAARARNPGGRGTGEDEGDGADNNDGDGSTGTDGGKDPNAGDSSADDVVWTLMWTMGSY